MPDEEADRARYELEVDDNPGKPKRMERGPYLGGDLDHEEGALPQEEDEGPALRELQAGGEYYTGLKKFWLTDKGREELEETLGAYQWGLKEALAEEEIKVVPMGEELGFAHGAAVEFLMGGINQLEDDLGNLQKDEGEKGYRMALLKGGCEEEPEKVLQTRTVPLQEVRRDLESWKEAMTDEYNALVYGTKVVKPVNEKDLDRHRERGVRPGKLVTTIKALWAGKELGQ